MTRQRWTYCFLVSAVLALLMPIASSTILVPSEGEEVLDLGSIDLSQLESLTPEELGAFIETVPTRKVEGLERFTYQFTHPQFLKFYLRSVAVSFVWLFVATVVVSYLGTRSISGTRK